jgi:hypothetical protein
MGPIRKPMFRNVNFYKQLKLDQFGPEGGATRTGRGRDYCFEWEFDTKSAAAVRSDP